MCATSASTPDASRPRRFRWWRRLIFWRLPSTEPIVRESDARRLARRVPLVEPFSLSALVREVEAMVGAPVVVQPFPERTVQAWRNAGEALPAALCVAGDTQYYVLYRTDTTPTHQRHSILHELGHICARHLPALGSAVDADLDKATLARAKHRSVYADDVERAAEAFAYTMASRIGPMRAHTTGSTNPKYQEAVDRYGSILEG